jgi:transcriptional regulator with XRE-family HTH domain
MSRYIGRRVAAGRALKGLSAGLLAVRAGLTTRRLEKIEGGVGGATAAEVVAVARVLGLPLWFFFDVSGSCDPTICPVCG